MNASCTQFTLSLSHTQTHTYSFAHTLIHSLIHSHTHLLPHTHLPGQIAREQSVGAAESSPAMHDCDIPAITSEPAINGCTAIAQHRKWRRWVSRAWAINHAMVKRLIVISGTTEVPNHEMIFVHRPQLMSNFQQRGGIRPTRKSHGDEAILSPNVGEHFAIIPQLLLRRRSEFRRRRAAGARRLPRPAVPHP